jgi:hypothetical protein
MRILCKVRPALLLCALGAWLGLPAQATVPKITNAQKTQALGKLPALIETTAAGPMKDYLAKVMGLANRSPVAVVNAVRVAEDQKGSAGQPAVVHYVVPAMSVLQRLPDAYPVDGQAGGELRIIAAKDEYEPASFQLLAFKDFKSVQLNVSDLKSKDGKVFPAKNLDLTVIKVWYQNGNGWYSYFSDVGLKLTPELLLHDENLIRVDREKKANFARVDFPEGSEYRWISAPRYMEDSRKSDNEFRHSSYPFADAKTMQPDSLTAGEFKQFFLTAHVAEDCPAGIYRGTISLKAAEKNVGEIPVAIRVLPFTLPAPKTYFDRDRDFVVTLMGGVYTPKCFFLKRVGGDEKAARRLCLAVLKNQRRHNILHTKVERNAPEDFELLKEAGFSTNAVLTTPVLPWLGMNWGGRYNYEQLMKGRLAAKEDAAYFVKHLGHTNVIMKYADEPPTNFVVMARNLFPEYLNYDFMVGTAGHNQVFNKAGYVWRYIASGSMPEADTMSKTPEWFNNVGAEGYTGFYAGQHNGVENPQYVRRQHGILSYLKNWSMIDNYEFGFNTWSDSSKGLYKPMNLAYPTSEGAVDTLAWEGFREGVDDMRYATKLMQLADQGEKSKDLAFKIASRKAKHYMALLIPEEADLNELRLAMVDKILQLQALAK